MVVIIIVLIIGMMIIIIVITMPPGRGRRGGPTRSRKRHSKHVSILFPNLSMLFSHPCFPKDLSILFPNCSILLPFGRGRRGGPMRYLLIFLPAVLGAA